MPAPQESPSTHQTPFFVFPRFEQTKIVTLRNAQLIEGRRSAVVSGINNAIKIAEEKKLTVQEMPPNKETNEREGRLDIPREHLNIGYGYVVDVANDSKSDTPTDAAVVSSTQLDQSESFEVHAPEALVALYEKDPTRQKDVAIVRILGAFMLQQPQE